jgi:hypothetical protein
MPTDISSLHAPETTMLVLREYGGVALRPTHLLKIVLTVSILVELKLAVDLWAAATTTCLPTF